ncbi:CHASE2 domain-containing protein [Trichlorobacter ammonificans]|uniref:Adenylate cyclase n=1 Tax=Trichlorobacter ammonificans TaxID=2916410 RepID=A0ABM9DBA0_9BACT|nr:adenylate/guanylate cyclase domain-containing protein [Trichlorobacter ammonificans]CAH2031622.1 Adenylate cyclase [Trichlorobacter ammonificans]
MKKRLAFLLFGLLGALLAFVAYRQAPPALQQLDYRMKDARFRVRGPVQPDKDVVVVAIDHASIKEMGRWPWSREVTGRLIENLASYGAKVTALDIVFSEPQNPAADAALARSIARAGNVVMGYFFREEEQPVDPAVIAQMERSTVKLMKVAEGVQSIPLTEYPNLDANLPLLGNKALDFGFFNARPDGDGLYRRSILLLLHDGSIYPSLAMKALRHYLGSDIMLEVQPWGIDSVQIGSLRVPAREDGTMALNYYGPARSFRTVSAADVIKKRLKPDELQGAIAFVGATEIGIYDIRPTPFDATQPGVELHATVAANALERRFLRYDGTTQMLEIVCVLSLPLVLGLLLALVPGTATGLVALAATTSLFGLVNYQVFSRWLQDMTVIYPLLGVGLTYLGSEAWRNLVVERKGRQLKKAFSNYVSPDLVREIEKHPDKLVLGGEQRELSILFSDIRGFTTVSESLTPPELVTLLNEYLSPMTRIVLEEKGTLDKFIGDAVMALFNAPLDVPDHATRACTAAVRMLEELKRLNAGFAERGMNTIDIGIGINTGNAVVGNMGADIRFDYTAIGDAVNLASRLEGLNKYYGSHILVSEDTRRQIADGLFSFREVDRVKVKGKHLPVVMFELMVANREVLPRFEEALERYRSRQFETACRMFEELVTTYNDGPSKLYVGRCTEYLASPPPADWDGVYTATSK